VSGYLVSNLSLEPVVTLHKLADDTGYLLVDLKLIKGNGESVVLTKVSLSMKEDNNGRL
jgi:hypothetical protein